MAKTSKATRSKTAALRKTAKRVRRAFAVGQSATRSAPTRVAALREATIDITGRNSSALLKILRNGDEPMTVRFAALQALQAAAFSSASFEDTRGDYIAALRHVAQDPHEEMRHRALGLLAREKDGFAQRKLLEGLRDAAKALVPAEKALQLLSYDIHAEAYPLARAIVKNPPNAAARREALRLLAADAESAPMFKKILQDKNESTEARQVSAAALRAVRPDTLQEVARQIVLEDDDDEVQATCLTALTQFGEPVGDADREVVQRAERLRARAKTSKQLRRSAGQYLGKYRP